MRGLIVLTMSFTSIAIAYDLQTEVDEPLAINIKCPSVDGKNATLIKHPSNCSIYYHCDMGVPIQMYCPSGLHFNNCVKVCDWPYRACCDTIYDLEYICRKCE